MAKIGNLTEGGIQSAVWQIELGHGKKVVYWILAILLGLVLGLWYTAVEFRGLQSREAIDQAQLARNLARGEGYTTYVVRPLSLWLLSTEGGWERTDPRLTMQHPDLENPPLYPWILAQLFKLLPDDAFEADPDSRIFSPERIVILPFGQVCLLATLAVVYFWGRRLFDHRVALTAALLLLFSDMLWQFSISGLSTSLAMLLVLLAFYVLFRLDLRLNEEAAPEAPTPSAGRSYLLVALAGLLLGLCFLTRYKLGLLLLPALAYLWGIWGARRAVPALLICVAVFALVAAPWLVRNHQVCGNWLGIAGYQLIETNGPFNGDTLQRTLDPQDEDRLHDAYSLRPIASKFFTGLRRHSYDGVKQIGYGFLVFFFGVGLLYGFRRKTTTRLRGIVIFALLVAILGMALLGARTELMSPTVYGDNLLVFFLPLVALFGVAFFYLLLDSIPFRMPFTRGLAIAAFALISVGPFILTILPPGRDPFPYPPYFPPITRVVATMFAEDQSPEWRGPDELGCSDLPWSMAWYGDRRTVWLPTTVDDYFDINDFIAPRGMSFMLLTPYMLDRPLMSQLFAGEFGGWSDIIRGRLPKRFPLKERISLPPSQQQFLFADKPRWSGAPIKDPTAQPEESAPQAETTTGAEKPDAAAAATTTGEATPSPAAVEE